jgi:flagellar basal body-associated protein FliL
MNKVFTILGLISRILMIIILVATSILSIGTAYIMFAPDNLPKPFRLVYDFYPPVTPVPEGEKVDTTPVVVEPGQGIIIATAAKIVNLNSSNSSKYIRITISLEFNPKDPKYLTMTAEEKATYLAEFNTEISSLMPIIDDVIITSISLKTFDDLYTADGKEKLRNELLEKFNARLPEEDKIIAVYFTEFVIN